jgi:hypothetical protein
MTTNQKQSLKHLLVVVLAFVLPLLPTLLSNIPWGPWANVEQAALALLGAIYVTLSGTSPPVVTSVSGESVNVVTK